MFFLAEQIDPNTLLQEMTDLERAVLESLAQTEEQRQLVRVRRDLSLLEKLTAHGLTPAEWKTYKRKETTSLKFPKHHASRLPRGDRRNADNRDRGPL